MEVDKDTIEVQEEDEPAEPADGDVAEGEDA